MVYKEKCKLTHQSVVLRHMGDLYHMQRYSAYIDKLQFDGQLFRRVVGEGFTPPA